MLAVPVGISLVALVPVGAGMIAAGGLYFAWRHPHMQHGLELTARAGYAKLVGGVAERERRARESHA